MTEKQINNIKRLASDMAACASERALSRDWKEHPMFGIAVDADKWATLFRETQTRLDTALRELSNERIKLTRDAGSAATTKGKPE